MSGINLSDLSYVAYQVTDLDLMARFLVDFGITEANRTDASLYMRGQGSRPFIHMSVQGDENLFLGGAFQVESKADLEKAANIPGSSDIVEVDRTGGGLEVTLTTPNGHSLWLTYGSENAPQTDRKQAGRMNFADYVNRVDKPVRLASGMAPILRLGHFVVRVQDEAAETAWFTEHFNLIPSDYLGAPGGPSDEVIGTFLRFDRGADPVEHHCLLINKSEGAPCHHSSFQLLDLDAVMMGHDHLLGSGWNLDSGVGRHLLGSLIYDYWLDPFGNRVEHYTDMDMLTENHEPVMFSGTADETTQWGKPVPPSFFD